MNVGDLVYVYLNDLKVSLPHLRKIMPDRFGHIINKEIIDSNTNEEIYQYKIECENTIYIIDSTSEFKICTIAELKAAIEEARTKVSKDEYETMIDTIKKIQHT